MKFTFKKLAIPDVLLIEHDRVADARGYFSEVFRENVFAEAGVKASFVQENLSHSTRGVLRGLHFQRAPQALAKVVRCLSGEVFDVAVDCRKGSPTFGKWVGETLSSENRRMLYVPEGFAHGFLVTSETADVSYKQTGYWSHEHEGGILWNDPDVGVRWPIEAPVLAAKDLALPRLKDLNDAI